MTMGQWIDKSLIEFVVTDIGFKIIDRNYKQSWMILGYYNIF